ncbi:MAG: hypothetical protein SangKO_099760 [Sandaracinaceae bacterium]
MPEAIGETDDELVTFWTEEERSYRETVERYFPRVAPHLPGYDYAPYEITVLRLKSGLIVGWRPSDAEWVEVEPLSSYLVKPDGTNRTIFELREHLEAFRIWVDLSGGTYPLSRARDMGAQRAFAEALQLLWHVQEPEWFEKLVRSVLEAEGVMLADGTLDGVDLVGEVVLHEPGGYRRVERWAYRVIGPEGDPLTEGALGALSEWLDAHSEDVVGACIVTSGDHSTVGTALRVTDPRLRLLDQPALVRVVHNHPDVLDEHFAAYSAALQRAAELSPPLAQTLAAQLQECPRGHSTYVQFEQVGTQALSDIFGEALGAPRKQQATADGVRRPDAIYPIRDEGGFWGRLRTRFGADLLVVDFKNHSAPIRGQVIDDASKYTSPTMGNFVLAVARAGGDDTATARSLRLIQKGECVLVLSDEDLVEMAAMRDRGEAPELLLSERLGPFVESDQKRAVRAVGLSGSAGRSV